MFDDSVSQVNGILADFANQYPAYSEQGFQIAGIGWFQGYNDSLSSVYYDRYEANMVFSFIRKQSSIDPGKTTVTIEVGNDMVAWTTPPSPYSVPDTASAGPAVAVVDNLDGTDTVTLTVPQSPDAKKFARLKVVITP